MRVIKVKGTGQASQRPDLVVIRMEISSKRYNYNEALDDVNKRVALLKKDLMTVGFNKEDVKTTGFRINTEYRYDERRKIFDGYVASQDLKLEFDLNQELLNKTLGVLTTTQSDPTFSIYFEVKDKTAFKNEILKDALENAKSSAQVIANTLGVYLGDLIEVNYDVADIEIRSPLMLNAEINSMTSDIDITPDDIVKTDEITVIWEIRTI